jgi:hypothetical protein
LGILARFTVEGDLWIFCGFVALVRIQSRARNLPAKDYFRPDFSAPALRIRPDPWASVAILDFGRIISTSNNPRLSQFALKLNF